MGKKTNADLTAIRRQTLAKAQVRLLGSSQLCPAGGVQPKALRRMAERIHWGEGASGRWETTPVGRASGSS